MPSKPSAEWYFIVLFSVFALASAKTENRKKKERSAEGVQSRDRVSRVK
jgi:hypothetical protein